VSCQELSSYHIVIYVSTNESARFIITQITVNTRTVALEVYSRRAALAYRWIVENPTTAVLISIVSQTKALEGNYVAAIPDF
jgi:hypothetical protein